MSYSIKLTPQAKRELDDWVRVDIKTARRIQALLMDIAEHPFTGMCKPEPLKNVLQGLWSRRINKADRIVYRIDGKIVTVYILSMRGHYNQH